MPDISNLSVIPAFQPEKLEDISQNDNLEIDEIQTEVNALDDKMLTMAQDLIQTGAPLEIIA